MILVTGGLGFLGSQIVRTLAGASSEPIRCLVRPGTDTSAARRILRGVPERQIELFHASFNDSETLQRAVAGVHTVYHAAASKSGSYASMVSNTVTGSDNLYRACVAEGVERFVLVSSFSVIGVADLHPGSVVDESAPIERFPEKRDQYAFSKQRQETLAWEYFRDSKLPLVVVRPGVVFGPGAQILGPRIGVDLFGLFLHLGHSNLIPLTYVDNCAEAIVCAGTTPHIEGEAFCIVDDDLPTSKMLLRRYSRRVSKVRSVPIPRWLLKILARANEFYSRRTHRHLPVVFSQYDIACMWEYRRFSNAKAKNMLSWRPRVDMERALEIAFDSLRREQEDLADSTES